jgi:ribosomal protein S7
MSSNILAKKKNKIYESIVEELIESSSKKSTSAKKRDELHKLAEENLVNFK